MSLYVDMLPGGGVKWERNLETADTWICVICIRGGSVMKRKKMLNKGLAFALAAAMVFSPYFGVPASASEPTNVGQENSFQTDASGEGQNTELTGSGEDGTSKLEDGTGEPGTGGPEDGTGEPGTGEPEDGTGENETGEPENGTGENETGEPEDGTGVGETGEPEDGTGEPGTGEPEDGTGETGTDELEDGTGENETDKSEDGTGENEISEDTETIIPGSEESLPAVNALAVNRAAAGPFSGGTGTAEDPYIISDVDGLKAFAASVNGTDGNAANSYKGKYISLTAGATYDLSGIDWTPIGNGSRSGSEAVDNTFQGSFDGAGATVTGVSISGDNWEADQAVGFFGVLDGGTVKNLNLSVSIDVPKNEMAGGAVGLMVNGGTVEGVIVSGTVSALRGNGGIVGRMTKSGTIRQCVNDATIEATGANAGGIVGAAYYTSTGEMFIESCINNGVITSESSVAGGIVGLSAADVKDCANHAAVTGGGYSVGGIVGEQQNYGSVTGCTNNGEVKTTGTGVFGAGGIVGWIRYNGAAGDYPLKGVVEISGNTNTASVTGAGSAGGIVGHIYDAAAVTGNVNQAPAISSSNFAAGIAGSLQKNGGTSGLGDSYTLTVINNVSTTTEANITGPCKDLWAYKNDSHFTVDGNSAAWTAVIEETGEQFASLQTAIDAAADGYTICLQADSYGPIAFDEGEANKTLTIDLKQHKIIASQKGGIEDVGEAVRIGEKASGLTLTIRNGSIENLYGNAGAGYSDGIYAYKGSHNLSLTLEEIRLTTATQSIAVHGENLEQNVTLKKCEVTSTGELGIYYPPMSGTLMIEDTKITAPTGIVVKGGKVNISGSTEITADGPEVIPDDAYEGSTEIPLTLTGDAVYVEGGYEDRDIEVEISGGTFISKNGLAIRRMFEDENIDNDKKCEIAVRGGSFSSVLPEEYCAAGYKPVTESDANGRYTVTAVDPVAEIGTIGYASLADAVTAAVSDDVIKLVDDIDLSEGTQIVVPSAKDITLDLNGHDLELSNIPGKGNIRVEGKLTLMDNTDTEKNGTGDGRLYSESTYSAGGTSTIIQAADSGTFVMESGYIDTVIENDTANNGNFALGLWNDGTIMINGGKIKAGWYAVSTNGTDTQGHSKLIVNGGELISTADYAIYGAQRWGSVEINGGLVYGAAGGIAMNAGNLNVTGGTVTSKGQGDTGDWGDGTGGLENAAIYLNARYNNVDAKISGGTITAEGNAIMLATGTAWDANLQVSGGSFSHEVKEEYCAPGFHPNRNADGTYSVHEHVRDSGTVTKPATETETGIRTYKCTICGAEMGTEVIPATGKPEEPSQPETPGTGDSDSGSSGGSGSSGHSGSGTSNKSTVTAAATGDSTNIWPWIILLVLAAGGGATVVVLQKKRKTEK